ncbi:unnamed protein product [Cuscuta campestris]|uniref:Uncharacterized protein n=1 Tax=Cuscuta campestris TaxID=132261 RepID=A0A484MK45_9ASTE|nr:unnamed protein product [Cuscuta campestris]
MNDAMLTLQNTHRSSRVWAEPGFTDKKVSVLPGNTDREAERYTASVVLQLLGGTLLPNASGQNLKLKIFTDR